MGAGWARRAEGSGTRACERGQHPSATWKLLPPMPLRSGLASALKTFFHIFIPKEKGFQRKDTECPSLDL